jgi:hypothetical protein
MLPYDKEEKMEHPSELLHSVRPQCVKTGCGLHDMMLGFWFWGDLYSAADGAALVLVYNPNATTPFVAEEHEVRPHITSNAEYLDLSNQPVKVFHTNEVGFSKELHDHFIKLYGG